MSNDGWGKAWPKPDTQRIENFKSTDAWPTEGERLQPNTAWDLGSEPSKTVIWPSQKELKAQGSNLVDAEAYLYFQCESCQDILDPHTRSFKTLQDKRHEAGWKVIWNTNGLGYKVYCAKCGDEKK